MVLLTAAAAGQIPTVTVEQMREVDRVMVEDLGIELLQMMENAGRALASRARAMLGGDADSRRVTVLAGPGGNGGGGMVAARRLGLWGADVTVVLAQPDEAMFGVPAHQLSILRRLAVQVLVAEADLPLPPADLLVDALVGYGLKGSPRAPMSTLIGAANAGDAPILALDIPSGLDGDMGTRYDPCIVAASTLTLALPKAGLLEPHAAAVVGELYLADISVPPSVYEHLGVPVGLIFGRDDIVAVAR